jgi:hypothetical protein
MKPLIPLVFFVLLATTVFADQFTTTVNITTQNNVATIGTEGWTANYVCNLNSTDNRTLTIGRDTQQNNLSATLSQNLSAAITNISETTRILSTLYQDKDKYAPLYTSCFANLTICKDNEKDLDSDVKNLSSYKEKYDNCASSLSTCETTKVTLNIDKVNCDASLVDVKTEKSNSIKNWQIIALIAFGLGMIAMYYWKVKPAFGNQMRKDEPPVDKGGMMSK